jgi:hypothetical protein
MQKPVEFEPLAIKGAVDDEDLEHIREGQRYNVTVEFNRAPDQFERQQILKHWENPRVPLTFRDDYLVLGNTMIEQVRDQLDRTLRNVLANVNRDSARVRQQLADYEEQQRLNALSVRDRVLEVGKEIWGAPGR